jgi:hypothetical protein
MLYSESDKEFQDFLGERKAKALNQGINEFENWLTTSIGNKNISDNYKEYLEFIMTNNYNNIPWNVREALSHKTKKQIRESGLYDDFFKTTEYKIIVDTVRFEIYRIPISKDSSVIIPIRNRYKPGINIDSLRQDWEKEIRFNVYGNYFYGLKNFSNDSVISEYIYWMEGASGGLSPSIVASFFLQDKVKYDDYLTKVVLFQEFCFY